MRRGRASPCIGVCSTTYGDLVCRGCNRFAHEVVEWNAYDEDQRAVIWERLAELRDGSVTQFLSGRRVDALCEAASGVKIRDREDMSDASLAYEVLRRLAMRRLPLPWGEGQGTRQGKAVAEGEGSREGAPTEPSSARALLLSIDREYHSRSQATYERSYKIPAD